MILVDYREGSTHEGSRLESERIAGEIRRLGIDSEVTNLSCGDFAFEGNSKTGRTLFGVERKKLPDMLNCIDDSRYNDQRIRMSKAYRKSYLLLEGVWSIGTGKLAGRLIHEKDGKWQPCPTWAFPVRYSKLYRYLLSVANSDVIITYSRDLYQTCYNISEIYSWYQKPWHRHHSLLDYQKELIPHLGDKPTLARRWAQDLTDIGIVHGEAADALFRTGIQLAQASELDWMRLPGIGVGTAQQIIREIHTR